MALPLMPEWYLIIATLGIVSLAGVVWTPLLLALPLFVFAMALPLAQAWTSSANILCGRCGRGLQRARMTVAFLHLLRHDSAAV